MRSGYCEGVEQRSDCLARLTGCKNFVGKRKKFIFNALVDLKPVERLENGNTFIRFDRIHERDRQTDTTRRHRPHLCTTMRGKMYGTWR